MTDLLGELLSILLFAAICGLMLLGFPIAFTLAGTSLLIALLGWSLGIFDLNVLRALPSRYFGSMGNEVLVAVPLFIFMGMVLERSGLAEQLLTTMGRLFGRLRGGLGYSVVLVGALLAASTGVVGATVVTMGLISLPAMMRAGYDPKLATGVICASSTLAQVIPPSTVLIFIGDLLQSANQTAHSNLVAEARRLGQPTNIPLDTVSVGELFAGALLPGLILVGLYLLWMIYKAVFEPESCPALVVDDAERRSLGRDVVVALLPAGALIVAVLGSILAGVATPTESGSIGAVGAMLLAAARGRLSLSVLSQAVRNAAVTTSMVFIILLGASTFSLVFRGLGGEALVHDALRAMPGGAFGAMLVVMLVMFVLGFFLDTFEIIFIMLPICGPVLIMLGVPPVWLGVMIGINLQTSFLTPPFGFTLFYMRGVAPPSISSSDIWVGSVPWTFLQVIGLALCWVFPATATWLPDLIFAPDLTRPAPGEPAEGGFGDLFGPASPGAAPSTPPRNDDFGDLFGPQ